MSGGGGRGCSWAVRVYAWVWGKPHGIQEWVQVLGYRVFALLWGMGASDPAPGQGALADSEGWGMGHRAFPLQGVLALIQPEAGWLAEGSEKWGLSLLGGLA